MRPHRQSNVFRVCLSALTILWFVSSCVAQAPAERDRFRPDIYGIRLRMAEVPLLNQTVSLEIQSLPLEDAPGTVLTVNLPEGIAACSTTSFTLELFRGQAAMRSVALEVQRAGDYMITVHAQTPTLRSQERDYYFFVQSSAARARAGDTSFFPVQPAVSGTVERSIPKALAAPAAGAPAPANVCGTGTITVTGSWNFTNEGGGLKPARLVTAELRDAGTSTVLETCTLDDIGQFGFALTFTGTRNLVVRAYADASPAKAVNGDSSSSPVYSRETAPLVVDAANPTSWHLGTFAISETDSPPFQAVDNVIDEWQFVLESTGDQIASKIVAHYPSNVCSAWGCAGWPCAGGTNIYLPDKFVNGCSWRRYTLYHEYAHNVQGAFAPIGNKCPSMEHTITTTACESFALVEGWAEFMEAAVANSPSALYWGRCGSTNVETNTWWKGDNCQATNYGRAVEGAVASVLWDIFDSPTTDDDTYQMGFNNAAGSIWQIMKMAPQGITDFWDKWISTYGGASTLAVLMQQNTGVAPGPIVVTDPPSESGGNVTLNGRVNPNGSDSTTFFEAAASADFSGATRIDAQPLPAGTSSQPISATAAPLTRGTNYYIRAAGTNPDGTSAGAPVMLGAPIVTISTTTDIGTSSARARFQINSNWFATSMYLEYSTDGAVSTSFDYNRTNTYSQPGSGTWSWYYTFNQLHAGTTYYYRVVASNLWGETWSAVTDFTTAGFDIPVAYSRSADAITGTGATLNAVVHPSGADTTYWFEYSLGDILNLDHTTPHQAIPAGTSWVNANAVLSGLTPNMPYYFRVVAQNAAGTTRGTTLTFTTPEVDSVAPTASITSHASGASVSGAVTLTASATDNVGVTGVQFKLDGTNLGAEITTAPWSLSWDTTRTTNGMHSLTASARDATGNVGTSATVSVSVTNSTEFLLALPPGGTSSRSVTQGGATTYSLQVTPTTGFAGTVAFTCSVTPQVTQGPTCTVSPSPAGVSGRDNTPITVSVSTVAPSNNVGVLAARLGVTGLTWAALLPGALMIGTRRRFRLPWRHLLLLAALAIVAALVACGGGGGGHQPTGGTPKGSYAITVIATAGTASNSASLNLTVN